MLRIFVTAFSLLLVGACAPHPRSASIAPPDGTINLRIMSWGKTVFAVSAAPDGNLVFSKAKGDLFGQPPQQFIEHRVTGDVAGYRRIADALAPARRYAGTTVICEQRITDQPYGRVQWSGPPAHHVDLDTGCIAPATSEIAAAVEAARAAAEAATASAPSNEVIVIEELPPSQ